jgi:hypothetical protein
MSINEGYTQQTTNALAYPTWVSTTLTSAPGYAYPGAKKRLAKTIVSFMPPSCHTYAEPFAGRGNVFWRAATTLQYDRWWLNDTHTAPFFRAVLSHGSTVQVPAHTREEFERQEAASTWGDPIAILLAPYLSYNGAGYAAGYRSAKGSPTPAGYERTLRQSHHILTQTQATVTGLDWKAVAADLGEDDFAYFDPPYFGAKVVAYRSDDISHWELVEELKNAKYRWLLSEYYQPIYVEAFGQPFWQKQVQLCSTNFLDDGGKERRVECLWRNY